MLLDWLVGARAVPWEPGREVGQGTHRPAACTTAPALSGQASEESREEALGSKSWEALGGWLTASQGTMPSFNTLGNRRSLTGTRRSLSQPSVVCGSINLPVLSTYGFIREENDKLQAQVTEYYVF